MKKILLILSVVLISMHTWAQQQELPKTMVRMLEGKQIPFNETVKPGRITLISFWATWCIPCKAEIKNIQKKLPDWKKDVDFDFMTVSIDDARAASMVRTYSKAQGWTFPTFLDANSDLKRSLNFQNIPYTIIVDQQGKIVFQHTGYEEGSEKHLFEKIKELAKK